MTAKSHSRGHEIKHENDAWIYTDNNEPDCDRRPCKTCGEAPVEQILKNAKTGLWANENIDFCIHPIVRALQASGIDMISSCCGHKQRNGWIKLADGRTLIIKKAKE